MSGGIITLMGSGELSGSMVAVHKELLHRYGPSVRAVFLDTPAGFQLNADQIAIKAVEYFKTRIQSFLSIASLKSMDTADAWAVENAYSTIRQADYILIGPGSPTYALNQWQRSAVPELLVRHIQKGGCLVTASAAALTMGSWTLPVYEIYKVGQSLHWVDGLNVLNQFGFNWVVLPHWNNAEGGNHDTRFCFMGAARFKQLADLLPETVGILGIDEHTALEIDLDREIAHIRGLGRVTLRQGGQEMVFGQGDQPPLELLRGQTRSMPSTLSTQLPEALIPEITTNGDNDPVWDRVHGLEAQVRTHLDRHQAEQATRALLALEGHIWTVHQELLERDAVGAVREIFRDLLATLGAHMAQQPSSYQACLAPLVDQLLLLRDQFRSQKQWAAADALRDGLQKAAVVVEDTAQGVRWHLVQAPPAEPLTINQSDRN